MKNAWRDIRLIPIVLVATVSLLALKVSGLVFDGGYTLGERLQGRGKTELTVTSPDTIPEFPKVVYADQRAAEAAAGPAKPRPWAQEMFNFNAERDVTGSVKKDPVAVAAAKKDGDITGSAGGGDDKDKSGAPPLKVSDKPPGPPKLEVAGASLPLDQGRVASPGERAVLERLQDRRQELETRTRELEMRESLIKAAEKRLEAKANELKELETRVNGAAGQREKAEAQRLKGIVQMYETMKPKDAARIFDRLDLKVLVEVSTQMNSRKMSEVLAQMTPEAAERLTVELAHRAGAQTMSADADQLPKIEGKPAN
ncbi:MAG: MotE family protein [Pseudolabrys sp.]